MFEFNGFGQRLQNLRKSKNMTQGEFADRLGVTSQAVSKWENELCYPDITLIPSIATILGVEVNYLFGYKEQDFKVSSFPKLLGDLPLVHQYKNVACYSSKEVDFINESGIKFKDGSTVELSNRLVVNVGKGEIKLLDGDDAKNTDFSVTSKSFEFGHVDSLDLEVLANKCEIVRSADDKCRVHAKGEARFINSLAVLVQEGKLSISFKNRDGLMSQTYQENHVRVELPCDDGKTMSVRVNGSGELISEIKHFKDGELNINGSGSVKVHDCDTCRLTINGSGSIEGKNSGTAHLKINGSGSTDWMTVQKLDVTINGSGEAVVKNAASANININGSGDVTINHLNCEGETNLRISGSGAIGIMDGECKKLDIHIKGSGEINAEGLTVQKAAIVIDANGLVTIGRVIDSSIEQIKKKGVINILKRGNNS